VNPKLTLTAVIVAALALGFFACCYIIPVGRYQLTVVPPEPNSQLGLHSLYRIDTVTGQIDWLAINPENGTPRTVKSWPAALK
jgi:hypothetical protein